MAGTSGISADAPPLRASTILLAATFLPPLLFFAPLRCAGLFPLATRLCATVLVLLTLLQQVFKFRRHGQTLAHDDSFYECWSLNAVLTVNQQLRLVSDEGAFVGVGRVELGDELVGIFRTRVPPRRRRVAQLAAAGLAAKLFRIRFARH